ncbi:MAG: glycosyltransferase [Lachnospiraceae bacterium]|nr:glycosyltransferase [Lachnospiraceae bacterium]
MMNTKRLADYIHRNGVKSAYYAIRQRLSDNRADKAYDREMKSCVIDEAKLKRQKETRFPYEPLISILVPTYKPENKYFREMLRSVKAQTYPKYELLLGNGGGISENTNAALSEAKGDYIALLDQDDFIEPEALYRIVLEINMGAKLIYTDEDKYDTEQDRYLRAFKKPDFDMELLLSNNYVCHFLTVERKLVNDVGGFRSEYDGAQDHDLVLRCAEKLGRREIGHVSRVLYHWRIHGGSTAGDPSEKSYAHTAGKRAIEDYLKRNGKHGTVIETEHRGFYRIEYDAGSGDGRVASSETSGKAEYELHLGQGIRPRRKGQEEELRAYLEANPDVGAIGGRVIDRRGRIMSSGYARDEDGCIAPCYIGQDYRLSGEFHMASLRREVDIISNQCVMLRPELESCRSGDSAKMCKRIRHKGYRIVVDPQTVYIKK